MGTRLVEAEKKDSTWFFRFDCGGTIYAESVWRLVTPETVVVTSADHGQLFGLPEPVDAEKLINSTLREIGVASYSCVGPHCDLIILFENQARLQFFNMSCGYESWRAQHKESEVICMGGGGVTIF